MGTTIFSNTLETVAPIKLIKVPFMSKILDKVVSAQLCSFLQNNDIYE